ncbi:MAG: hypothetical protein ACRC5H_00970 [Treponemataceae bacterium]
MIDEQKEFILAWNQKYNEAVSEIHLVKLLSPSEKMLEVLDIHIDKEAGLWGLLLFGKKVYFFAPASESAMATLLRTSTGKPMPKDQLLCLSDFLITDMMIPTKKTFFSFFLPYKPVIKLTLNSKETRIPIFLEFYNISTTLNKMQSLCSMTGL